MRYVSDVSGNHFDVCFKNIEGEGNQARGTSPAFVATSLNGRINIPYLRLNRNTSIFGTENAGTSKSPHQSEATSVVGLDQDQQRGTGSNVPVAGHENSLVEPRNGAWGTEALQPVGILSKEAKRGRFTLESILSVPEEIRPSTAPANIPESSVAESSNLDDPITSKLLSFPVALGLFDRYCLFPFQ